jgi:hypothetical protein
VVHTSQLHAAHLLKPSWQLGQSPLSQHQLPAPHMPRHRGGGCIHTCCCCWRGLPGTIAAPLLLCCIWGLAPSPGALPGSP